MVAKAEAVIYINYVGLRELTHAMNQSNDDSTHLRSYAVTI